MDNPKQCINIIERTRALSINQSKKYAAKTSKVSSQVRQSRQQNQEQVVIIMKLLLNGRARMEETHRTSRV